MTRRKMCFYGCTCAPCAQQRAVDNHYTKNRRGDPAEYLSRKAAYRRAARLGLTEEQVAIMEEACGNLCEICGKPEHVLGPSGSVKALAVDHDKETGKVRGLLCNNCNRGLGLMGHDVTYMERALAYLRKAAER